MVTIQQGIVEAIAFAQESLGVERTQGIRLEEIESAMEGGNAIWRITLSMPDTSTPLNAFAVAMLSNRREYKTFTVLKDTGEVVSMKIREMSKA